MYSYNWYNSGDVVPDQVTLASDATPSVDNGVDVAGIQNDYAGGDHQHPLQVSFILLQSDTATRKAGTANSYARSDHTHHVNLSNNVPLKDTGTGTAGTANMYASAAHQHPLNVDPTVANVPLVNATAAANGTRDYYCRNDHVHHQQLTYDGNFIESKFIKTATGYDDGLRIARTVENIGGSSIFLGCSRSSNVETINGQWQIFSPPSSYVNNTLGLNISLSAESDDNPRGLVISADRITLTFNG
ncbi:MAG: hypothetical protein EZS28_030188 [Streblomastix strix]|uniref:Uncharacterized protein n=1 Tax=Streblomastix strix TaxID=222440 RepID=A0A5J4UWZ6_9EUKA|nr:MAG: hypothetical protein EZS28_030188 [Streblomastix strix]